MWENDHAINRLSPNASQIAPDDGCMTFSIEKMAEPVICKRFLSHHLLFTLPFHHPHYALMCIEKRKSLYFMKPKLFGELLQKLI